MKCPFRTIITKQNIYGEGDKSGKVITAVTSEEFADCIKNDCPYYGKKVLVTRDMGGYESRIKSACRKILEEAKE